MRVLLTIQNLNLSRYRTVDQAVAELITGIFCILANEVAVTTIMQVATRNMSKGLIAIANY